jgi:HSP20 family protein
MSKKEEKPITKVAKLVKVEKPAKVEKPVIVSKKEEVVAKPVIPAEMFACLDDKSENYMVEIELPGVRKENIELKMLDDILQVRAERRNLMYLGVLTFPFRVDPKKAEAEYAEGLLSIKVPVQEKRAPPTTVRIR